MSDPQRQRLTEDHLLLLEKFTEKSMAVPPDVVHAMTAEIREHREVERIALDRLMLENKYRPAPADLEKLEHLFGSNPSPTEDQRARIAEIRAVFRALGQAMLARCPPGRLLAECLTDLEKACHSAVKAVAMEDIIPRR